MQDISNFTESFNLRKLSSYYLNIQLSKFGLEYTICDLVRNQYVAVVSKGFQNPNNDIIDNLQKSIIEDVYLNKHYKSVNFILANKKYTVIPAELFDKKNKSDYFNFNQKIEPNEEILFSNIEQLGVYDVFAYPSLMINFLVNHFPEVRFFHSTYTFLSSFAGIANTTNNSLVGVNFFDDYIDIVLFNGKSLIMANSFDAETQDDAIFQIMNIFKKFGLNYQKTELYFQGNIDRNKKVYQFISKYIPQIKFRTKFEQEFPFKQVAPHFFANILNTI